MEYDDAVNDEYIVGYCAYCKDPVYETENFEYRNCKYYHSFCYRQMNLYFED